MRLKNEVFGFVIVLALVTAFFVLCSSLAGAEQPKDPGLEPEAVPEHLRTKAKTAAPEKNKAAEKTVPEKPKNIIKMGNVTVNIDDKTLEMPGIFSENTGVLEYLAVQKVNGKEYESLISIEAKPNRIQAALLLCDLKYVKNPAQRVKKQGDDIIPVGDPVVIYVEWEDPKTKKVIRVRAEELVYLKKEKKKMTHVGWVFTGSRFVRNEATGKVVFASDMSGSIIALYHDPDAILDLPLAEGNDDEAFEVSKIAPPQGTKCKIIIDAGVKTRQKKSDAKSSPKTSK